MDTVRPPLPRPNPGLLPDGRPPVLIDGGDLEARYQSQPLLPRLGAIVVQRCPVCLGSPMFRDPWQLNDKCPGCGHHYRQPRGFPRVVMHTVCGLLTLAVAIGIVVGLTRLMQRVLPPRVGLESVVLMTLGIQLLLVPGIYRYTRVIWAHLTVRTGP